jgi:hypothetical protein
LKTTSLTGNRTFVTGMLPPSPANPIHSSPTNKHHFLQRRRPDRLDTLHEQTNCNEGSKKHGRFGIFRFGFPNCLTGSTHNVIGDFCDAVMRVDHPG